MPSAQNKIQIVDTHETSETLTVTRLQRVGYQINRTLVNELQDQFLYSGKHRPSLYLDPAIRENISSFARLSSESEVQIGLDRLSADIQSGAFPSIAATYATELGDYAYIQCTR